MFVCDSCIIAPGYNPQRLVCKLCRYGYRAPSEIPDLVAMKRLANNVVIGGDGHGNDGSAMQLHGKSVDVKEDLRETRPKSYYQDQRTTTSYCKLQSSRLCWEERM